MILDINQVMDIQKSPLEILMDEINSANQLMLRLDDFVFSAPEPSTLPNVSINTKVLMSPKQVSAFYNSIEIHYKRMDLATIFGNYLAEVDFTTELMLSELIAQFNTVFGINLTDDDYYEQLLPVRDPLMPGAVLSVQITAKPDSYLFMGNYLFQFGPRAVVTDTDAVVRRYYTFTKSNPVNTYCDDLIVLDANGVPDAAFFLLRNARETTQFRVTESFLLQDNSLVIHGSFATMLDLDEDGTYTAGTFGTLILDPSGAVLRAFQDRSFGTGSTGINYADKASQWVYFLDTANAIADNESQLYRYNQFGVQDITFDPTDLAYVPKMIAFGTSGKFYTVSHTFEGPVASNGNIVGSQIRIDKFNNDGSRDTDFTFIELTMSGLADPLEVVEVKETPSGLWVALLPTEQTGGLSEIPLINGIGVLDINESDVRAVGPVFKFSLDGEWDRTYKNDLLNNTPETIYVPTLSNVLPGDNVLANAGTGVVFFTHHQNPITGNVHRSPIAFTDKGDLSLLSGDSYMAQYYWTRAKEIAVLSNGDIISWGEAKLRKTTGGWTAPEHVITRYRNNGKPLAIIYRKATGNSLSKVIVFEKPL